MKLKAGFLICVLAMFLAAGGAVLGDGPVDQVTPEQILQFLNRITYNKPETLSCYWTTFSEIIRSCQIVQKSNILKLKCFDLYNFKNGEFVAKLRKARKLSLVEDVVSQIESAILDGEYKPGDKLPATRKLQEIFGASMGTIRESLAILDQKGLLEVRKGAKGGFFIQEVTTQPMTDSLDMLMRHMSLSPKELYEFRATVEAGVIRLVVQRAKETDVLIFCNYLDKFEACLNNGRSGWLRLCEIEQDLRKEFLKVIKNRTYEAVLMPIISNLLGYARYMMSGGNEETKVAYDYWKEIIPAVAERDEDRAAKLVKELLFHFMHLMLQEPKKPHNS